MLVRRTLRMPLDWLRIRLGGAPPPRAVTYLVTWRCSARCVMCPVGARAADDDGRELELAEVERIFRQLPDLDIVRLSGGEPFLREDLAALAKAVRRHARPRVLHVTTNGLHPERAVRFVEALGRAPDLHLKVSIDAVGAAHDAVRGVAGAYEAALETVRALAARRGRLGFYVGVNQTIVDRRGLDDMSRLAAVCGLYGVDVLPDLAYADAPLYHAGPPRCERPAIPGEYTLAGALGPDDLERFFAWGAARVRAMRDPLERAARAYMLHDLEARLVGRGRPATPPCVALRSHLRILPDGGVPLCLYDGTRVGDLRTSSVREVLDSPAAARKRAEARRCVGCSAGCELVPNAAYSGDLLRALLF